MTFNYEFRCLLARLRAPLLSAIVFAFAACDNPDPTEPTAVSDPVAAAEPAGDLQPSFASAYQGGIPFGFLRQPNTAFGVLYSGAKQTLGPNYIMSSLREAKARGGKVFVMLADAEKFYKDGNGHFSFTKWKARIDRFKGLNLNQYITDGTIIGHFMIDEPQDPANWNGRPLTAAQLEAMAKYSKQLWPSMVTVVRAPPTKLRWTGAYRYLDAAWAQVENVRGNLNLNSWYSANISAAKAEGLALVVGLNVSKGNVNRTRMTATQVRSWGSTLLNSTYPCAFMNWVYDPDYARGSHGDAMRILRSKSQNRPKKSCRGS
jgi:hypothetical protein